MKTIIKQLGLSFLAILLLAMLVACGNGEEETTLPQGTYTLTFVTDGGTAIPPITAEAGKPVTPPADPEKEGYTFEGWYESASFSGVAVSIPTVMPARNVTYYAKFEEIDENITAVLTLDVGEGGTLSETCFELPMGTKVADFLKDHTPALIGDVRFAGWYDGANPVSAQKTLPRKCLTLTAKYNVNYSVSIFTWSGNKADYTPEINEPSYASSADRSLTFEGMLGDEILQKDIQSALLGEVDASLELDRIGSTKLTLGTSEAANTVSAYYKWKKATVVLMAGYATESEVLGEMPHLLTWVGESVTLPENGYIADHNRFAGWGATATASVLYPAGTTVKAESGTNVYYANWNYGMPDSAGGYDRIYLLREEPETVLLERIGLPEKKGSYDPSDRSFVFMGDGRTGALVGKISPEADRFVYYDETRDATFSLQNWTGVNETVALKLDGFDGAIYTVGGKGVAGTYRYDQEADCFLFTADTADFAFFLEGTEFRMRHDATANAEYMSMASNGRVTSYPSLVTDGFGNSALSMDALSDPIYATYTVRSDADGKSILVFDSDAFPFAECQVQTVSLEDGSRVAVYELPYTRAMTVTYPVDDGSMTFTTNGYDRATYTIAREGLPQESGTVSYYALGEYDGYYYLSYANGMDPATGNERIYQLRVKNGETVGELIGEETGLYLEGVNKGGYTVSLTLYSNGTGGGYAVLEMTIDGGMTYTVAASGTYRPVAEKEQVFRLSLEPADAEFVEITAYYNALPFRVYPDDGSFILEEDERVLVYTFTMDGREYTLTCDGYGMATLQDHISTKHVRYAVIEGHDGCYFLLYSSDSQGSALLTVAQSDVGVGKIPAKVVDAVFGEQGLYIDRFGRLPVDATAMIYYDGYMQLLGKDASGNYTVPLSSGLCTEEGVNTGLYRFAGSGEYADLVFSVAYYGDECWILPYNAEDKALSGATVKLDGSGLCYLTDGYYHYVIKDACVELYALNALDGAPVYTIPLEDGALQEPELMGTYYLYEDEDIGEYAILIDGFGNAVLKLLSLEGEYIDIIDHKLAVGTYTLSSHGEDILDVVFTGDYAHLSGPIAIFDLGTICIYAPGDYANEREYTVTDGGTVRVDAFNMVIYTTPDGYNDPAWEAYLREVPNAIGNKTIVMLEIIRWEGNVANLVLYGEFVADGNMLTPITSVYGDFRSAASEGMLSFDGLGNVTDGTHMGTVFATANVNEYTVLWNDNSEMRILLSSIMGEDGEEIVYTVYDPAHDRECHRNDTWETMLFDGYGNVLAVDALGMARMGTYTVSDENTYTVTYTDGTSETVVITDGVYTIIDDNA